MRWGLGELADHLTELGVTVTARSDDELTVALSGDDPDDHHPATVTLAGSSDDARLLTVSVAYPFTTTAPDDVRQAGALLEPHFVLGHTAVADDGSVQHRYAMPVDVTTALPAAVLTQTFAVLDYEQVHFGDYLEALCRGDVGLGLFTELVSRGEAADHD